VAIRRFIINGSIPLSELRTSAAPLDANFTSEIGISYLEIRYAFIVSKIAAIP